MWVGEDEGVTGMGIIFNFSPLYTRPPVLAGCVFSTRAVTSIFQAVNRINCNVFTMLAKEEQTSFLMS